MTSADSWHDGLGLPLESGEARAVELAYSYADDASAIDAFPLRSGLAVPIASEEERLGTLVVYWRRGRHRASEHELIRLERLLRVRRRQRSGSCFASKKLDPLSSTVSLALQTRA